MCVLFREASYLGAIFEAPLGWVTPLRAELIQPKLELIGKGPLEVVHQGPVHEASHIIPILHSLLYLHS